MIPIGDKAISVEVQATFLMMKNLCKSSTKYTDRERERERHKIVMCIPILTTVTTITTTNLN